VDEFSHQPHGEQGKRERWHPLIPPGTEDRRDHRRDDDWLGYGPANAGPPAQDAECGQGGARHVQEEGGDSVLAPERREEQLLSPHEG
jgi:hypothetical protein